METLGLLHLGYFSREKEAEISEESQQCEEFLETKLMPKSLSYTMSLNIHELGSLHF